MLGQAAALLQISYVVFLCSGYLTIGPDHPFDPYGLYEDPVLSLSCQNDLYHTGCIAGFGE